MTKAKVYIVFYSTYLHVYQLALAIKQGLEKVSDVDVSIFQIQETLPTEVLEKMHAPPKPDVPIITPDQLVEADGILFGYPTRFGTLPAQLKNFIDACGQLWAKGSLQGKMLGTFVSTATQHGGQETSTYTFLTTLAHFGLIYVPFGYSSPHLNDDEKVMGGSPWGASILAGKDGLRQASPEELEVGSIQGEQFGKVVARYVAGRNALGLTVVADASKETVAAEPTQEKVAEKAVPEAAVTEAAAETAGGQSTVPKVADTTGEAVKAANATDKAVENENTEKPKEVEAAPAATEPAAAADANAPAEVANPDAIPTGTVATEDNAPTKVEEVPEAAESSQANGGNVSQATTKESSTSTAKSSGGTIKKLFKRLTLRGKKKPEESSASN